jgi:hypothetical protein
MTKPPLTSILFGHSRAGARPDRTWRRGLCGNIAPINETTGDFPMPRRLSFFALCIILALGLAACGTARPTDVSDTGEDVAVETAEPTPAPMIEPTAAPVPTTSTAAVDTPAKEI